MSSHTRCAQGSAPLRPFGAISAASLLFLGGCASLHPPELDTESVGASAAGLAEPIAFHIEGRPLDEPGNPESLTLAEAVRLAVTTDPGVQMALARVRMAIADARQARMAPNPVLNLALRFPEGGGSPIIEASLAQDLVAILRIPRQASAADNRLRESSADAVTEVIDVVAQVQERFASVRALEELLPVLRDRLALGERVLGIAQARLDAGEGTREDVTVLESQHVEIEVELADMEQSLRDERLALARLIGRPSSDATWPLGAWTPPELSNISERTWVEAGLRMRPEVQAVVWKLAALGDERALARLIPFEGTDAGVRTERDGDWSTGPELAIPIPIFDIGQARVERATAEQIEARHELVQVQRQVIEDVRRALEALTRSRENLDRVRTQLIPLQESRRSLADAAFRAGQTDVTAIFLAEQDLRAAQAKAVELDRQVAIAAIRVLRAVGGPGPAAAVTSTADVSPTHSELASSHHNN